MLLRGVFLPRHRIYPAASQLVDDRYRDQNSSAGNRELHEDHGLRSNTHSGMLNLAMLDPRTLSPEMLNPGMLNQGMLNPGMRDR